MDFLYSPSSCSPSPPHAPTFPLKELWKTLTYERSYFYVKYLQIEKLQIWERADLSKLESILFFLAKQDMVKWEKSKSNKTS